MNKPTNQLALLITVLTSTIVCPLIVQSVQGKEPYYKGKPLSDWLCCEPPSEQQEAIRSIGTSAIPIYLDILGATPKGLRLIAARLDSKGMSEQLRDDHEDVFFGEIKRTVVETAFATLDTNAESAIPQLVKLLNKDNDDISPYAAEALAVVGPKGFAALTNALTANNPSTRQNVAMAIGQFGQDPKQVAQILIILLKDESPDVRRSAADSLAGRGPDTGIPVLMPMLDDKDPVMRQTAARALSNYGTKAKDAASKIFSLYTNGLDKCFF